MLTISKDSDPNYLATVVICPEMKPHPNAQKLEIVTVFGGDVIVAKECYAKSEKLIYFPVESCISTKFLSWANLLDKAELNADGKTKGFFSPKNGRVRAIKLREIPSQGFLFKVSKLAEYYGIDESVFKVGESFDTVKDDLLVKKYIRNERGTAQPNEVKKRVPKWIEKTIGVFPKPIRKSVYGRINAYYNKKAEGIKSLILDGQWKFHYSTENAGKQIFTINPEHDIVISSKWHGTSFCCGNILCKKPFNIFRFFGEKLGLVFDAEYKFVYASRSILKNRRDGKYTEDVWGKIAEGLDGNVPPDYLLYGELVGWSSNNKMIQKNYDYGVPRGEVELRVYRITKNTPDGNVELSWEEIEQFCKERGLETVPVYYKGKAKDMFDIPYCNFVEDPAICDSYCEPKGQCVNCGGYINNCDKDKVWREQFLAALNEKYLNKTDEFCTTGVVNEGIVIRNESKESKTALKYKSPLFVLGESAARDKGEEDMEEES